MKLQISSVEFDHNGKIPSRFTCDDQDVNPELRISGIPAETKSLALVMDDPDAPVGVWDHWVVWNINPTEVIKENSVPEGAVQGRNGWGKNEYGGPCPPSGEHRYFFKVYALSETLDIPSSSDKKALEKAIKGKILAQGELIGKYRRKK